MRESFSYKLKISNLRAVGTAQSIGASSRGQMRTEATLQTLHLIRSRYFPPQQEI